MSEQNGRNSAELAAQAGEKIEDVIEKLAYTDDTNVVVTKLDGGKFKVTSKSWDDFKVILPGEVLELRMVDGRIRIARKHKHRDTGDLQQQAQPVGTEGEIIEFLGV